MRKKSFTIIEILITMLIMGTMSATIIPRIGDAREETEKTVRKINETRDFACELGLGDVCDNDSGGGDTSTSNGIHYDRKDISVCREGDCITMMDRNLGATSNDILSSDSYGNYYQRGNNYGFPNNVTINKGTDTIDCQQYGPKNPLSRDIFIITGYHYCLSFNNKNNNLRGGWKDKNNNYGYPVLNPNDRQGPCPEGYHVPSIGERRVLFDYWAANYASGLSITNPDSYHITGNSIATNKFIEDFKIPFAGYYYKDATMKNIGSEARFWPSSPASINNIDIYNSKFTKNEVYINTVSHGYVWGFSIRCFKNPD